VVDRQRKIARRHRRARQRLRKHSTAIAKVSAIKLVLVDDDTVAHCATPVVLLANIMEDIVLGSREATLQKINELLFGDTVLVDALSYIVCEYILMEIILEERGGRGPSVAVVDRKVTQRSSISVMQEIRKNNKAILVVVSL